MAVRKGILALTLAVASFCASDAYALSFSKRPPPTGGNGPSLNGLDESGLAAGVKHRGTKAGAAELQSVVLPDGSRIVLK